jgi:transposase-like protein
MAEIRRLTGDSDASELGFVERERTPSEAMQLGIQIHLGGVSLSDTVSILETYGVDRSRKAVHDWVHKADLQPTPGRAPNQVALDETVIRVNDEQYWLYAAIDTDTNEYLHVRLFSTYNSGVASIFLGELKQKHDVEDAEFLVDGAPWLHAALHRHGLRFQHVTHGNRNAVERVFKELKRRTDQFANHFRHADPATAESWLQALAFQQNQLN